MINSFYYSFPTVYYFGIDSLENLDRILPQTTKQVLVLCGKSSAQKLGICEKLTLLFRNKNINLSFYEGCSKNPSSELVKRLSKKVLSSATNTIIAIGGGSVIDLGKAIVYELKDIRQIYFGTVLTIPSSGSESNRSFVIYDEVSENKIAKADHAVIPRFAICDPSFCSGLSKYQISCCLSDIMAHLLEQMFSKEDWNLTDDLILATIKNVNRTADLLLSGQKQQDAWSDLVLASSFSLSYILSCGRTMDWVAHTFEHAISGKYNTNHAEGMRIIMPEWIRFSSGNEFYHKKLSAFSKELPCKDAMLFIEDFYNKLQLSSSFNDLLPAKPNPEQLADTVMAGKDFIGKVHCIDKEKCLSFLNILLSKDGK